jgi:hypothetical protein
MFGSLVFDSLLSVEPFLTPVGYYAFVPSVFAVVVISDIAAFVSSSVESVLLFPFFVTGYDGFQGRTISA